MKNYALINSGVVSEIIAAALYEAPPDWQEANVSPELWQILLERVGTEIPITDRFTPDFVAELVDISGITPVPEQGMIYADGVFSNPPGPTSAEIFEINRIMRDSLLASATLAIGPLQDAMDLGDLTEGESALLKKWKEYRRDANRVDLLQLTPQWPSPPA